MAKKKAARQKNKTARTKKNTKKKPKLCLAEQCQQWAKDESKRQNKIITEESKKIVKKLKKELEVEAKLGYYSCTTQLFANTSAEVDCFVKTWLEDEGFHVDDEISDKWEICWFTDVDKAHEDDDGDLEWEP